MSPAQVSKATNPPIPKVAKARGNLATKPQVPPRILALVGQKGGVGKTSIACFLAAEALSRDRRVLLVDADNPQRSARRWADQAIERGQPVPTVVEMGGTMAQESQLPALATQYDLTIIDCPGRHDATQGAALMLADLAILPCRPSSIDGWALDGSLDVVQKAMSLRPELRVAIVINGRKSRTAIGASIREQLTGTGFPVLGAELGDRVAYIEALGFGRGVGEHAPRDRAAHEIKALYDEIMGVIYA